MASSAPAPAPAPTPGGGSASAHSIPTWRRTTAAAHSLVRQGTRRGNGREGGDLAAHHRRGVHVLRRSHTHPKRHLLNHPRRSPALRRPRRAAVLVRAVCPPRRRSRLPRLPRGALPHACAVALAARSRGAVQLPLDLIQRRGRLVPKHLPRERPPSGPAAEMRARPRQPPRSSRRARTRARRAAPRPKRSLAPSRGVGGVGGGREECTVGTWVGATVGRGGGGGAHECDDGVTSEGGGDGERRVPRGVGRQHVRARRAQQPLHHRVGPAAARAREGRELQGRERWQLLV